MGLQPLGDRVLVEVLEEAERVQGGIVLPESAAEKPTEGTVVEVGPGALKDDGSRIPMQVAKGDKVIYGKYSGMDVKVDGQEYKLLRVSDILAVRQ
ncbi:MAG: co-chaperone GroES [Gammaproteobacteria bacterium]|nr:co-chaperone GroES [Gammaproteobacteria bacterium]